MRALRRAGSESGEGLPGLQRDWLGLRLIFHGRARRRGVAADGRRIRYAESGFRDALCGVIGQKVSEVDVREGDRISLRFAGGGELITPLDPDSMNPINTEAARFIGHGEWIQVWGSID